MLTTSADQCQDWQAAACRVDVSCETATRIRAMNHLSAGTRRRQQGDCTAGRLCAAALKVGRSPS